MILEAGFGGITPHSLALVGRLARRAQAKGGRDGTRYGSSRTSARGFFVHHTQQLALAAQRGDARGIRDQIRSRKQRIAAGCMAGGAP